MTTEDVARPHLLKFVTQGHTHTHAGTHIGRHVQNGLYIEVALAKNYRFAIFESQPLCITLYTRGGGQKPILSVAFAGKKEHL